MRMIESLRQREIDVILMGMLAAPNLGNAYRETFDAIFPRLAESYGVALYPFFLDGVVTQSGLMLDDGMHPNAEGVGIMVERVLPLIEETLAGREG
jgi:acyl-CoA thioesterase I